MNHCIYIFSDKTMFAGAKCLIYSLFRHHSRDEIPIIFGSTDHDLLETSFIKRHTIRQRFLDPKDYDGISPVREGSGIGTFFKGFEAFRNYGFKKNIVMDADMLCLGRLDELWKDNDRQIRAAYGVLNRMRKRLKIDYDEYNAGMMVVDQSIQGDETVNHLIERARARRSYNRGDQGVLHLWSYEEKIDVEYISQKWNMVRRIATKNCYQDEPSGKLHIKDCRMLHFTGKTKPWLGFYKRFKHLDQIWYDMEAERQKSEAFRDPIETKGSTVKTCSLM